MKDEIRRYLEEHGGTYTPDALRGGLLTAGYEPAEVDAALKEWGSERARAGAGKDDRRSFGQWSLLIYLGALVGAFLLTVLLNGTESGLAVIGAVVLSVFLLIAWGVSTLLGRLLVPRVGLIALLLPLIFALGLGGTCLAIMDGMTPARATPGTVELRIDPPLSFSGSGTADCFVEVDGRSSSIYAGELGTLDGRMVAISLNYFLVSSGPAASAAEPVPGPDAPSLYVTLGPLSETDQGATYTPTVDSRLAFESSTDGLSGTVTFEHLVPEVGREPGSEPTGDPISGTLTWTCEARR